MVSIGVVFLIRSRIRRLSGLRNGAREGLAVEHPPEEEPFVLQRFVLIVLLVCCLMLPSNWTQNIPERYGKRHAGLEHSWFYPDINTSAAADEP